MKDILSLATIAPSATFGDPVASQLNLVKPLNHASYVEAAISVHASGMAIPCLKTG